MNINTSFSTLSLNTISGSGKNHVTEPLPRLETRPDADALAKDADHALQLISDKIKYLEEIQDQIDQKLLNHNDDLPGIPPSVSSIASAERLAVTVRLMLLKNNRYAMMAQANAVPDRVLSLIDR